MNRSFFWLLVPPFIFVFLLLMREQAFGWIPSYQSKVPKEILIVLAGILVALQIAVLIAFKRARAARALKQKELKSDQSESPES